MFTSRSTSIESRTYPNESGRRTGMHPRPRSRRHHVHVTRRTIQLGLGELFGIDGYDWHLARHNSARLQEVLKPFAWIARDAEESIR
jgi:hypothetical protein